MDDAIQARLVFAPIAQTVTFMIDGVAVQTDLYNFLDLPVKDALAVYALEDEMRAASAAWPDLIEHMRRIIRLLCPKLEQTHLDALVPRQLQDAIAASHGVVLPPPGAEAAGAASPSASAGSTTPSPPASTGDPGTSRT